MALCAPSSTCSINFAVLSTPRGNRGTCFSLCLWVELIPAVWVALGQMVTERTFAAGPVAIIAICITVLQTSHLCLAEETDILISDSVSSVACGSAIFRS